MSKIRITTIIAAFAMASSAFAADLPSKKAPPIAPVPTIDWSGLYFGATGGYAFDSHPSMALEAYQNGMFVIPGETPVFAPYGWAQGAHALLHNDGFVAGGNLGVQKQFGIFVLGGEASIEVPIGGNTHTATFPTAPLVAGIPTVAQLGAGWTTRIDGTGKLGVTILPNLLLYVGGGPAAVKTANSVYGGSAQLLAQGYGQAGETFLGWHVKGGIDFMILPGWSAKIEFDHADFGEHTVRGAGLAYNSTPALISTLQSTFIGHKHFAEETVRVGITYHTNFFGGENGLFFIPTGNVGADLTTFNTNVSNEATSLNSRAQGQVSAAKSNLGSIFTKSGL